jgi:DNA polymerase-1
VGTYGDKYLKAIHPHTGRIHFRFRQYGTETGRPACMGGLNCLNIPRDKKYRKAFITEPGRLISTVDYSAAELRILADLSGEQLMIDGFNSGIDFHCYVASLVFKKEVTKKNENAYLRDPTKTINFGIAYGLGPGSLFEQLNGMGHKCTRDEAKDIFYQYKRTFPTMIEWLESQQNAAAKNFKMVNVNGRMRQWIKPIRAKITQQIVDSVTQGGKLELTSDMENLEVRPRVEEKMKSITAAIKREGANFQIQSVNADFTKAAMYELRKEFKRRGWDARMYNSVYDEIVMDMDESIAEEAHELQKTIMKREADKMLKHVSMEVEGHLETHWTK